VHFVSIPKGISRKTKKLKKLLAELPISKKKAGLSEKTPKKPEKTSFWLNMPMTPFFLPLGAWALAAKKRESSAC
jgi:hypothetical protein